MNEIADVVFLLCMRPCVKFLTLRAESMASDNERFGLEARMLESRESELLQQAKDLALELHSLYGRLSSSKEIEYAKARLEEAAMWASKHIGMNGIDDKM